MAWFRFPWQSGKSTRAHKKAQNKRPKSRRLYPTFEQLEIRWLPTTGVSQYSLTAGSIPWDIINGPDGNLWFTENGTSKVAKISTSGSVTEYSIPTGSSSPEGICVGPDGNLWFTENATNKIGKVTTSGSFTEYTIPTSSSGPAEITPGSDGNLWFTENSTNKIAKVTTAGSFTEYSVPTSASAPLGITPGPDGNLWFTENATSKVARVTTSGSFSEYATTTSSSGPWGITFGADGNAWFTENSVDQLGMLNLRTNLVTEISVDGGPRGITLGPDNNLWFAKNTGHKVSRLTSDGTVFDFELANRPGPIGPHGVSGGPDNGIWATEKDADKIAAVGSVVKTVARTADPLQALQVPFGDATVMPATGGVTLANPLDFSQGGVGVGVAPALVYRSDTVNVYPVLEQTTPTSASSVPSEIDVTLTWNNGSPQSQTVFQTTGHSAGDTYLLSQQVASAVTSTNYYPWQLDTTVVYSGSNVSRTITGNAAVVVNGSSDPFGYGWGVAGLDSIQAVTNGVLWVYGSGGARFFSSTGGGTFVSPPNDFGTLTQSQIDSTYTYTAKDQTQYFFDSTGQETKVVDTHLRTLTYTYSSGRLSTVASPDGGVTTFHYDGSNLLDKITEPGNRVVTVAHNGSGDLTSITNPDGGLRTFTYTGSHQVTNEQWGSQCATYAYDGTYNRLSSVDRGAGVTLTVAPEINQGLATSPARNANQGVGVLTDGLSHATTCTLDTLGRLLKVQTADGATQSLQLDFAGQSVGVTDQLGHTTTYSYQYGASDGDPTKITYADGSSNQFQYDPTFHEPTVAIDGNGNRTTMAYDGVTGDLTTLTNALNQTTTYAYYQAGGRSNGLVQSMTDALGNSTSFGYDSAGHMTTAIRGYGTSIATTATMIYDTAGNLLSDTIGQSTTASYNHPETTSYAYDGMRHVTKTIQAYGAAEQRSSSVSYDALGQVVSVTDGLGNVGSYGYDPQGRPTKAIQGYGSSVAVTGTMIYDAAGNILSATTGQSSTASYDHSATVSYAYDAVNRPTKVIEGYGTAVAVTATMIYDTAGNVLSQTTGQSSTASYDHSATVSYAYDVLNRPVKQITGYGTSIAVTATMIYDADDNLLSETTGQSTTAAYSHQATASYAYDALNRPTATIEAYGAGALQRSSTVVYDAAGNILSTIDPLGHTTSYGYNALNQATQQILAYGTSVAVTATMIYDAAGNLLSDTTGHSSTVAYDHSATTSFAYNALNQVTQQIRGYGTAAAVTATMLYDAAGNILSATTGQSTTSSYNHASTSSYAYDALNRPVKQIAGYGTSIAVTATMVYDAASNLLSETTGQSTTAAYSHQATTSFAYDVLNRPTVTIEAYGAGGLQRSSTVVYDAAGNVLSTIDALGHTASYSYNALDQQTQQILAYGTSVAVTATIIYDASGNLLSETTGHSSTASYDHTATTSFAYDALNQVTQQIRAYGTSVAVTATMLYDVAGNLLSDTTGQSSTASYNHASTTSYAYDSLNRPVAATEGYGVGGVQRTGTVVYDAAGNAQVRIDGLGIGVTMVYDALNRLVSGQNPVGIATAVYDAAGNVVNFIDANNAKSTFVFDALNRPTLATDPRGGITSAVFDAASNRISLTDPDNNTTTFTLDTLNRVTQQTDALNHSATYAYSATDQLTSTTDALGRRRDLSYDGLDRQTQEVWVTAGTALNTLTYNFDAAGNLLTGGDQNGTYTFTYDALNRATSQKDIYNLLLTYAYDAAGNTVLRQDSQSGVLTSVYDALNRLTSRQFGGPGQTTMRIDATWTARSQLNSLTRYSDLAGSTVVGSSTYGYDAATRLTNLQHKDAGGSNIASYVYSYDPGNRLTVEQLNGALTSYGYDLGSQLTTVATGSGSVTYAYDANGNRTSTGYQTGTANQLTNDGTWTYTYDAAGNLAQKAKGNNSEVVTYTYDHFNHLLTVSDYTTGNGVYTTTYRYDVFGDRIAAIQTPPIGPAPMTEFGYDGPNAWIDMDGNGTLQTRRLYLDGLDQLFARISSAGTAAWYLTDRLGSVRDIQNYAGTSALDHIDYNGFGNVTTETQSTNGDRYKYTGRELDSQTGLQYSRARYYDGQTGRWTTADPISFSAGDTNLYRYVANAPTDALDPSGLRGLVLKGPSPEQSGLMTPEELTYLLSQDPTLGYIGRPAEGPLATYFDAVADGVLEGSLNELNGAAAVAHEMAGIPTDAVGLGLDLYWSKAYGKGFGWKPVSYWGQSCQAQIDHGASGYELGAGFAWESGKGICSFGLIPLTNAAITSYETGDSSHFSQAAGANAVLVAGMKGIANENPSSILNRPLLSKGSPAIPVKPVVPGGEMNLVDPIIGAGEAGSVKPIGMTELEPPPFEGPNGGPGGRPPADVPPRETPPIIYKEGRPSPSNLRPRPKDNGHLSFRDSLSNPIDPSVPGPLGGQRPVFRPGEEYLAIDTSQLPPGSVRPDGVPGSLTTPPGHVSVVNVPPEVLQGAVIPKPPKPPYGPDASGKLSK